jgi:hypothetical protein
VGFYEPVPESAQHPGEEICAEARKEGHDNLLLFRIRSMLWYCHFVSDDCSATTDCWPWLGRGYTSDTKLAGEVVFTGSFKFQVKEIEVFGMAE